MFASKVTIALMRRVQVKDYEPKEFRVEIETHIEEGDDTLTCGYETIKQCKELMIAGFDPIERGVNAPIEASVTVDDGVTDVQPVANSVVAEAEAAEKPKRGRKTTNKPATVAAPSALPDDAAGPDAGPAPAPTPTAAPAASPTVEGEPTTGAELQQYVLSLVHQGRIDPAHVKGTIYKKHGIVRALELKTAEQVAKVKAEIDAAAKPRVEAPKEDLNDL